MRALRGGIPRVLPSHRTEDGDAIGRYLRAMVARVGPLGREARPTLRDLGDTEAEILRLRRERDQALGKSNRKALVRRLERDLRRLRYARVGLERRLEELASEKRTLTGVLNGAAR